MKYFQSMLIDRYISFVLHDDIDAIRLVDPWNIEKDEIVAILTRHFHQLGIFVVAPLRHAEIVHRNILFLLTYSPELRQRLRKIQEEIARSKARNARHKS